MLYEIDLQVGSFGWSSSEYTVVNARPIVFLKTKKQNGQGCGIKLRMFSSQLD
jgi:hypothetical protein